MTASLAYRKNEAAILRGDVPEKYTRILPHIPGHRILEVGSAEGVLACMMTRNGKSVTAIEANQDRHAAAVNLHAAWSKRFPCASPKFVNAPIGDSLDLLDGIETLVAVRVIYYFREGLDSIFSAIAEKVPTVVLCGNRNRADSYRAGRPREPLGPWNYYASAEGMCDVLQRHGYATEAVEPNGDEIVVGRRG